MKDELDSRFPHFHEDGNDIYYGVFFTVPKIGRAIAMQNFRKTKKCRGFALIEAIIVVMIVAIFAVMALPRLDSTGVRVRRTSRQIMDDMRYARTLAVTENKDVVVDFTSDTQYVIDGTTTKILPDGITCVCDTPTKTFTFHKRGDADSNGTLVVSKGDYSSSPPISIIKSTGMAKNG